MSCKLQHIILIVSVLPWLACADNAAAVDEATSDAVQDSGVEEDGGSEQGDTSATDSMHDTFSTDALTSPIPGDLGPADMEIDPGEDDSLIAPQAPTLCGMLCGALESGGTCVYLPPAECLAWCENESTGPCGDPYKAHFECLADQELLCEITGIATKVPDVCSISQASVALCEAETRCEASCDALAEASCDLAPLPTDSCKAACVDALSGGCALELDTLLTCNGTASWSCDDQGNAQPDTSSCQGAATLLESCQASERCDTYCAGVSALPCAPWPDEAACRAECQTMHDGCPQALKAALTCHESGIYACDGVTQALVPFGANECAPKWEALSSCSVPLLGPSCQTYCQETEALLCRVKDGEAPEPDVLGCTASCLSWKQGTCSDAFNSMLSCNGDSGFVCLQDQPTPNEIAQCSSLFWQFQDCVATLPCADYCEAVETLTGVAGCEPADALTCEAVCSQTVKDNADCEVSYLAYIGCVTSATALECSDSSPGYSAPECSAEQAAYSACIDS